MTKPIWGLLRIDLDLSQDRLSSIKLFRCFQDELVVCCRIDVVVASQTDIYIYIYTYIYIYEEKSKFRFMFSPSSKSI